MVHKWEGKMMVVGRKEGGLSSLLVPFLSPPASFALEAKNEIRILGSDPLFLSMLFRAPSPRRSFFRLACSDLDRKHL